MLDKPIPDSKSYLVVDHCRKKLAEVLASLRLPNEENIPIALDHLDPHRQCLYNIGCRSLRHWLASPRQDDVGSCRFRVIAEVLPDSFLFRSEERRVGK